MILHKKNSIPLENNGYMCGTSRFYGTLCIKIGGGIENGFVYHSACIIWGSKGHTTKPPTNLWIKKHIFQGKDKP